MPREVLTNSNTLGSTVGADTASLISLYGVAVASQRATAVQAASVVSASSYISIPSNTAAFAAEVAATLTQLGAWKGSA